jgi:hypothetical protein
LLGVTIIGYINAAGFDKIVIPYTAFTDDRFWIGQLNAFKESEFL